MINRTTKLRWRRRYRRSRKQVGDISQQAEVNLERHLFKRLTRLIVIRRFLINWVGLLIILIGVTVVETYNLSAYYQTLTPAPGGSFTEGIVGNYTTSNPLFATSGVDLAVSHLIFAGLLKYDQNNKLVPDLAQSWSEDSLGENYTVTLRGGLKWQDGAPLTAQDLVFTFQTIQNPDVRSPLFSSWQGVTIKALNATTVRFTLPNPLSSFPQDLTTGIIPMHLLNGVSAEDFRSLDFDTIEPIGAGPFKWEAINVVTNSSGDRQEQIGMVANKFYYQGSPRLDRFVIQTYNDDNDMINGFNHDDIDAMAGLDSLPTKLNNDPNIYSYNIPLAAEVMTFFNNSSPILSDIKVRQALVEATNETSIISGLGYPVIPAKGPLLSFQIGYNPAIVELPTNDYQAEVLLNDDGWAVGKGGIRMKDGNPLQFQLFTLDTPEYNYDANALAAQWKVIGVDVQVVSQQSTDFQTVLQGRGYDALLYGITIGSDPDVFVYWDSSQAATTAVPGLNLSEYKSSVADESLEAGRTRVDPALRAIKYKPFLQSWQSDAPAVSLYQPRFLYVSREKIFNFNPTMFNNATDRYYSVNSWMVREIKKTN